MDPKKNDGNNPPNPNPNPDPNPDDGNNPPAPEMVSKAELDHVLADLHKLKAEKKAADDAAKKAADETLKANQKWEEYAKNKEEEANDFKAKYEGLLNSSVNNAKFGALKTAAIKAGIHDQSLEDLEMLDFPEVRVESTSQGRVIVHGADAAIEMLKKRKPHWFTTKAPSINPASPDVRPSASGKVTLEEIERLEGEYKKNPASLSARKALQEAIYKYKQQNP